MTYIRIYEKVLTQWPNQKMSKKTCSTPNKLLVRCPYALQTSIARFSFFVCSHVNKLQSEGTYQLTYPGLFIPLCVYVCVCVCLCRCVYCVGCVCVFVFVCVGVRVKVFVRSRLCPLLYYSCQPVWWTCMWAAGCSLWAQIKIVAWSSEDKRTSAEHQIMKSVVAVLTLRPCSWQRWQPIARWWCYLRRNDHPLTSFVSIPVAIATASTLLHAEQDMQSSHKAPFPYLFS